jgi:hypothetical protein
MPEDRDNLLSPVKLATRQKCFFGCVLCGCPVYHYDHIIDYSEVLEHDVDNLTLLCPTHHQDKSSGRLSRQRVQRATANPYNAGQNFTSLKDAYYDSDIFRVEVGDVTMEANLASHGLLRVDAINVDGGTVIGVRRSGSDFTLWLRICDESNQPIVDVRAGECKLATSPWDITYEGRMLRIRSAPRQIVLALELAPDLLRVHRGMFWVNGYSFEIKADGSFLCGGHHSVSMLRTRYARCMFYKGDRQWKPASTAIDLGEYGRQA